MMIAHLYSDAKFDPPVLRHGDDRERDRRLVSKRDDEIIVAVDCVVAEPVIGRAFARPVGASKCRDYPLARCPPSPDSDQIPERSEMTLCDNRRHCVIG